MTEIPPPFDALWFKLLIGFMFGAALGSFITMLSYRLPRKLSIIAPRSHCTVCQSTLSPGELVPIASWVVQRGACRTCHAFMGWRYVFIEIVTGLSVMLTFALIGFSFLLFLPVLLIIALITSITILLERK